MGVRERFEHDGVEAVRFGRINAGVGTTCIVYRLGGLVFDSGPPNQWRHVRRFLDERGVDRLLLTHHHEDHSGNCRRIEKRFATRPEAHPTGIEILEKGYRTHFSQQFVWGFPHACNPKSIEERVEVDGGLVFDAVHAPGHAHDMACFHEPNRGWLFSGDNYVSSRIRYFRYDEDFGQQVASLRHMLTLDFDTLFCAHYGIRTDGRAALQEKLDHFLGIQDRARALHAQGKSVRAISREVMGPEDFIYYFTTGRICKQNLIRSALES